jgi:hypothetical protein
MDLFRRMAGRKPKKRGREPTWSEGEAWLRESLQNRPVQIQRSYHQHVSRHGHRYEIGDSIAHTSLAHTLLTLNSGLIRLINQALSKEPKKDDLSRRSLLSLSEMAAADTLNALSQLSLRLASQSQLTLPAPMPQASKEKADQKQELKLKGGASKAPTKKRPGPSPLLVRGGWVRPKTSSVVSSSSSKSGSEKAKPSNHQRSKSESAVSKPAAKKQAASSPKLPQSSTPQKSQAASPLPRQRSQSDLPRPERLPSMFIVPSDLFLQQSQIYEEPQGLYYSQHPAQQQYPIQQPVPSSPPRPPKIPLHTRPNPNPQPQSTRPKSSGTLRSASTKIGEIPDRTSHHLHTVQEQAFDPRLVEYIMSTPDGASPDVAPHMVTIEQAKIRKRGRGFRFWKKEIGEPVAAY